MCCAGQKLGFSTDHGNLHSVSLGQGQESGAEKALETAAVNGHWVILQVMHFRLLQTDKVLFREV